MNYSFEYIDIILLAMIAGFIFLRLRGILGKKTGHEENLDSSFSQDLPTKEILKNNFLVGGKINNKPIKSVANPGKINNNAAKASAAPDIIS